MTNSAKLLIGSLVRHAAVAFAGFLATRGLISTDMTTQATDVAAAVLLAAGAQGWAWLHTTSYAKTADQISALMDQLFAVTAPMSAVVPALVAPSGKLVHLPQLPQPPASNVAQQFSPAPPALEIPATGSPVPEAGTPVAEATPLAPAAGTPIMPGAPFGNGDQA